MARSQRFARGAAGRSQARQTSWIDLPFGSTTLAGGGVALVASLTAAGLAKRPFTVERTHLFLHVTSDQVSADEFVFGAAGWCVVSDQALAIGVTAVPTPVTDQGSDLWFLHQAYGVEFALTGTGAGADSISADGGHQYQIDSKAKRKVGVGQDLIFVLENAGISFGSLIRTSARILIKES